jgi:hypothetical protein
MSLTGILFILLAVAHIAMLVWGFRVWRNGNRFLLPLLVLNGALAYDNIIIALGTTIVAGDTLYALSMPRFWAHALLTPLIAWVAYLLAYRADLRGTRNPLMRLIMLTVVAGLTYAGIAPKLQADFEIHVICQDGLVRYSKSVYANQVCTPDQEEISSSPPIGSIGTIVVVIGWGVAFLAQRRYALLLAGGVIMLIGGAIPTRLVSPIVGNFSEWIVLGALYLTALYITQSATQSADEIIQDEARATAS